MLGNSAKGKVMLKKIRQCFTPSASTVATIDNQLGKVIEDPRFTYLVSFPRTGSHWLRMLMELYFEKPSLMRVFYFHDATEFTCLHHHDEDLELMGRWDVIYLYRDPVDTIYSQMKYYKEDLQSRKRLMYWSELYGKHVSKWLFQETFTKKKTILTYEGLKKDLQAEFRKICEHFGMPFDASRLEQVSGQVSKAAVKKRTKHDKQVMNLSEEYETNRERFRKSHGGTIIENFIVQDCELKGIVHVKGKVG